MSSDFAHEIRTNLAKGKQMAFVSRFIFLAAALLASVPRVAVAQSIPDGFYYKLSTEFRGTGMKLDVLNGGPKNNMTRLEPDQNVTGQFWRIMRIDGGWHKLSTQFRGSNMCLDIFNGGQNDNQPHLSPCGNLTGQHWKISGDNHMFRLTTEFRGPDMCLDIFNGGENDNQPQLRQCGNVTGQAWTLTRTNVAVEGFAVENPAASTPVPARTSPSGCKPDEVYSSSIGQCIPRALGQGRTSQSSDCKPSEVYSSSMGQCVPKSLGRGPANVPSGCKPNEVYSSSMGQCIPRDSGSSTKVIIPHGCPYNLDKVCTKTQGGLLIQCRCAS